MPIVLLDHITGIQAGPGGRSGWIHVRDRRALLAFALVKIYAEPSRILLFLAALALTRIVAALVGARSLAGIFGRAIVACCLIRGGRRGWLILVWSLRGVRWSRGWLGRIGWLAVRLRRGWLRADLRHDDECAQRRNCREHDQ